METVDQLDGKIAHHKRFASLYGHLATIAGLVALGMFMTWYWPTNYVIQHTTLNGQDTLVRINRFSGKVEPWIGGKWGMPKKRVIEDIPSDASTGRSGFEFGGSTYGGRVDDGTEYTVTELTIEIAAKDGAKKELWKREYTVKTNIAPKSAADFSFLVLEGYDVKDHEWWITSAKSYTDTMTSTSLLGQSQ